MKIINKLNNYFFEFVRNNLEKSEEEIEVIRYGMQVIFFNIFKVIILFFTAYLLGVFKYTLIAFVSFGLIRTFSSGVHANSGIKCIIGNYVLFLGNVFVSLSFKLNKTSILILFLISLILIIRYAPADSAERPLVSKKLRKALKIKSCITAIGLLIVSIVLANSIYSNIITYAVLEEAFLVTPLAYFIFRKPYKNYEKVQI